MRTVLAAVLCIAGFSQLSCKVNDYCLDCLNGSGGSGDGGIPIDGDDGGVGMDGSGSGSACVQTNGGVEICDGKDNDCNGLIDDGTLPTVGDACQNQTGECAGGKLICTTKFHCSVTIAQSCNSANDTTSCPGSETCVAEGIETDQIVCDKIPTPERCDGKDNDCNGVTDEGDPGGGSKCGTDQGECVAGTNHCINGSVQCQGAVGGSPEVCDAKDNDCDGNFDEGLTNMGTCGSSGTAPCMLGTLQCMGGAPQCVGAVNPTFEICDGIDNDCNGTIDDGYDKQNDPQNCGATCTQCTVPASFNANPTCVAGACGFSCKLGYQDKDGNPANGCEFGPCFPTGAEVCDGQDNDCDGNTDEGLTAPSICLTKGECAGTVAQCTGAGGWVCNYNSNVETDAQGNVVPQESRCDDKDNDCDGAVDEGDPLKENNVVCHDNQVGICQTSGHYICKPGDVNADPICDNSNPGQTAAPEACDNVDNDCDGNVDEDLQQMHQSDPAVVGEDWVDIGGNRQMAKYEMSKPDSSATDPGSATAHACSRAGVQPWVNVTYAQALAACQSVGATLCSESEWHRACSTVTPSAFPITVATTGTLIEAEDYTTNTYATSGTTTRAWVEDNTPGFSGISALQVIPDTGANVNTAANAVTQSPRLDYNLTFGTTGNYHVWVRQYTVNSNANEIWVGITTVPPATPTNHVTLGTNNAWTWVDFGQIAVNATGARTLELYMQKDGARVDAIYIVQGNGTPPGSLNGPGNTWSYRTNPTTYQPTTCNGHDYDPNSDSTLTTGSLADCFSAFTATNGPHDLSGNVKEWALAHQPNENPIRGGAANNTGVGISCGLNFTLADDTFFFVNVGFRCCRAAPPP